MEKMGLEGSIKELKDYTLIEGELYKRLPGGILSRYINEKEGKLREAAIVQEECQKCWLSVDREEIYAIFVTEDWRTPFMEYLAQGILPTDRALAHRLRKLAVRYFLQNGILFKRGYTRDTLRCLGPKEAREAVREVHFSDCGSHPGKKRLYRQLLQLRYYWPTMKKDSEELVRTCHACQVLGDAIHTLQ
ncbi:hypothetical protein SO802_006983 [Lithocarpus litseifolius]|uniref:Integrase zinc-binding domain-containing protein n=1 Tax=Lithocarpus litseifolius TaxID=425828 RepID=A0AAW2DRM2_9ROSI